MKPKPIASPLPGEHLVGVWPTPEPETEPGASLRLNFWAGRALTADALELEQESRAARLAGRGRLGSAGVVTGLGVSLETPPAPAPPAPAAPLAKKDHYIHVSSGYGITAAGDDVLVPRPLRVELRQIPVLGEITEAIPKAAVLLLRPAEIGRFGKVDPDDPCELDLSRDAFADERRVDAAVLWLYPLPDELLKDLTDADFKGPRWRNLLAHVLFTAETARAPRQQTAYVAGNAEGTRWSTALRGRVLPHDPRKEQHWRSALPLPDAPGWELEGLPVALLSTEMDAETGQRRFFLDREAVVRPGGWPHPRSRPAIQLASSEAGAAQNSSGAGTPSAWRARVEQFAEHLAGFVAEPVGQQAAHFRFLPPVGLLPRAALNFLNTDHAKLLPPSRPGQPPDRANNSSFFPPAFAIEAVPVPVEDLDAAFAASAALAPYDLAAPPPELVRLLVPLPLRVFDPKLLVVELVDPFFRSETNRLLALRQDWRQRRDFVRGRRHALARLVTGAKAAAANGTMEDGQLETEPVEAEAALGFSKAIRSPLAPESVLRITLAGPKAVPGDATFHVRLRLDAEAPPTRIEFAISTKEQTVSFAWEAASFPSGPEPVTEPEAPAPAFSLWRDWLVRAADLTFGGGDITGLEFTVQGGRVAVALVRFQTPAVPSIQPLWQAADADHVVEMPDGVWETLGSKRCLAPFEDEFIPVLDDDPTLEQRVVELEQAANPGTATQRPSPFSVKENGLERVLAELEAEANEADDFVDANFTRAQTNLYRIRKHILGENAAQKLLINPAIATIAEQETASATAAQLNTFLTSAKSRSVAAADINKVFALAAAAAPPPGANASAPANVGDVSVSTRNTAVKNIGATLGEKKSTVIGGRSIGGGFPGFGGGSVTFPVEESLRNQLNLGAGIAVDLQAGRLVNIRGQLPESGPILPPRGLSLGERFIEPTATKNLSYARAALQDVLDQLPKLRLPLLKETIQSLGKKADGSRIEVPLLALQGRAKPAAPDTAESLRKKALGDLLTFDAKDTDESEVTLAALDLIDIKSVILRLIERVVQERLAVVARGREALAAVRTAGAAAQGRFAALQTKLAEARHDVAVARALWREETDRLDGINQGRDDLLAKEVKFLAYVRPRTVDPVRRSLPAWHLEASDAPAPVPACLQRHDEPPEPLEAYVQLFRHAPVRWFPEMAGQLARLDKQARLAGLLSAAKDNAARFLAVKAAPAFGTVPAAAVLATFQASFNLVHAHRQIAAGLSLVLPELRTWLDQRRDVEEHASLGDLIEGQHGQKTLSRAAAAFLEDIEQVATCLHVEFAAVPPATRLRWVERYSQFDKPAPLRDLTALPGYSNLARDQRRRFQDFATWLFSRVEASDSGAFSLVNDLVRLCLLLASHAPVNQIITGHLPQPTPIRPGVLIPIRPLNPALVRVGMEFHVWNGPVIAARGRVEDLRDGEVSARVEQAQAATLDVKMKVQFIAPALNLVKQIR